MKKKNFYITFLRIAVPMMVQELIFSLTNILDTFMIGSLGVHEITAVGLANQLFFLFILFIFGICSGSAILMGQYWGAEDVPSIKKTTGLCLCGSILGALIFSCAAIFAPSQVMSLYSKDIKVIEIGTEYLGIIWISYVLCACSMTCSVSLKSIRQTKAPMITTIISLSCNAVLNYVFIYILEMGVPGAAIATVIARLVELAVIIAVMYGYKLPVAPKTPRELFTADLKFIKYFAFVTLPVLLNEFSWALGTSLYNVAYKHCGTEAQGALQISNSVTTLFSVVGIGAGFACGIMIANELGAGETERAIRYSHRFMKLAIAAGISMGVILAAVSPFVVNIFNVSDTVKGYAVRIMIVFGCILFTKMFNFTTVVGILRSGGDTWFCFGLDMFFVWVVGLPMAFLGAAVLKLPVYWVVALVALDEVAKLPVTAYRTLKNGWAKKIV